MAADPLVAYRTWRAGLSADDRTRWAYLLSDGEPLLVDVIKTFATQAIGTTGLMGGLENSVVDTLVRDVAATALKALQAP